MQSTQTAQSPARSLLPRFAMGRVTITSAALATLQEHQHLIMEMLNRHCQGDWGDVCEEDAELNNDAVKYGGRLLSSYLIGDEKLWIITEADRSATTLLMADEY